MSLRFEFDAILEKVPDMNACFIRFPYDVFEVFGKKNLVKVKVWMNGEYYRGSLANMGMGCHVLPVIQAMRKKIGKHQGDLVHFIIEQDTEIRLVEVPDDLQTALSKEEKLITIFDNLSYSHRKEYVVWINGAKKEETRSRRIQKCLEMLSAKVDK